MAVRVPVPVPVRVMVPVPDNDGVDVPVDVADGVTDAVPLAEGGTNVAEAVGVAEGVADGATTSSNVVKASSWKAAPWSEGMTTAQKVTAPVPAVGPSQLNRLDVKVMRPPLEWVTPHCMQAQRRQRGAR